MSVCVLCGGGGTLKIFLLDDLKVPNNLTESFLNAVKFMKFFHPYYRPAKATF